MVRWVVKWQAVLFVCAVAVIIPGTATAQEDAVGPEIVYFGLLRADDTVVEPTETTPEGAVVYDRPFGSSFSIVVEAARGTGDRQPGSSTFEEFGCPDLQVQVSRSLGNGSEAVCDTTPPDDGGIPATSPLDLSDDPLICDAFNDLGCRFLNGAGDQRGRLCSEGCVLFGTGQFGCVSDQAAVQFCGRVARSAAFPVGETILTVRVRDVTGNLGPPAQAIVRIATPAPTPTPETGPDNDGCRVGPSVAGASAAVWILPPLLLFALRRLRRR